MNVSQLVRDLWEVRSLPRVAINLEAARAKQNDPFYQELVEDFYRLGYAAAQQVSVNAITDRGRRRVPSPA